MLRLPLFLVEVPHQQYQLDKKFDLGLDIVKNFHYHYEKITSTNFKIYKNDKKKSKKSKNAKGDKKNLKDWFSKNSSS